MPKVRTENITITISGPQGSGKTTIANLIKVLLAGHGAESYIPEQGEEKIGMMIRTVDE